MSSTSRIPALGVNVDHVATVRQARRAPVPDPVAALARADVLLTVQPPSLETIAALREGSVVIGFMQPHADAQRVRW